MKAQKYACFHVFSPFSASHYIITVNGLLHHGQGRGRGRGMGRGRGDLLQYLHSLHEDRLPVLVFDTYGELAVDPGLDCIIGYHQF